MKYTIVHDYSKVGAYNYLDEHSEYDIVFNLKTFYDPEFNQHLNFDMVAMLFAPIIKHERFVVTVSQHDTDMVVQFDVIRYYIILRGSHTGVSNVFDLRYYIQLYNWPADLYILEDATLRERRQVYSEMRNVSLSNVRRLKVLFDCELLGFYKAVDSNVYFAEDNIHKINTPPRLCSSCTYYSGDYFLPCAVNTCDINIKRQPYFECIDYCFKYMLK